MRNFQFAIAASALLAALNATAQPPLLILHETDETLMCPCDDGTPVPYGSTAFLMVDVAPPGHGPEDVLRTWFVWCGENRDDCEMRTNDLFLPPHSYYVRVGTESCCWSSAPFEANLDVNDVELSGWTCSEVLCRDTTLNPRGILTVDFTNCLRNIGCPCDNPQPLPPDTPVRFWRDMPPIGLSVQDIIVSEFAIGSGSGWEHWDCRWVPSPDSSIPWGHYYFTIQTDACCWRTEIIELSWGNLWLSLGPEFGQCYELDCQTFAHSPFPVENLQIWQESEGTCLWWSHDHRYTDGYQITLDGAIVDTVERYELGACFANVFAAGGCVTAFNGRGNAPAFCDSVDVPMPTPPSDVHVELVGSQSRISWSHAGENIEYFGVWSDSTTYVHVPPTEREWTFDRHIAWACVNAHNTAGWSISVCDTVSASQTMLQRNVNTAEQSLSAYPNPFNSSTRISFDVEQASSVSLQIVDITGRRVAWLFNGFMEAGLQTVHYSAIDLPSGVYFLSLEANQRLTTTKLLLLK